MRERDGMSINKGKGGVDEGGGGAFIAKAE